MNGPVEISIRPGRTGDVAAVLGLLDGAVRWLVERGRTGQWGTEPQSTNAHRVGSATTWARDGCLHLAVLHCRVVGALAVGSAPDYVPAVDEPELYVNMLVTDRSHAGMGIRARLLAHARQVGTDRGASMLRVDCYAGGDRALVGYYEGQGFTATDPFTVHLASGLWPGLVLARRLG